MRERDDDDDDPSHLCPADHIPNIDRDDEKAGDAAVDEQNGGGPFPKASAESLALRRLVKAPTGSTAATAQVF